MSVRLMAELRPRGEGAERRWVGVFWPVNEIGEPVGGQQMEVDYGGPGELGPRLTFNLIVKEMAKQTGWSLVGISKDPP